MSKITQLREDYAALVYSEIARYAKSQGWDIGDAQVYVDGRDIKVDFGRKRHLVYVDQGTKPYLMTSLEGKVIPIGGSFRHVQGVGLPGMTSFERNGVQISRWRDQKWRHPGIKPRHFVKDAMQEAESKLGYKKHVLRGATAAGKTLDAIKAAFERLWR